jgi:hypothetical protein
MASYHISIFGCEGFTSNMCVKLKWRIERDLYLLCATCGWTQLLILFMYAFLQLAYFLFHGPCLGLYNMLRFFLDQHKLHEQT